VATIATGLRHRPSPLVTASVRFCTKEKNGWKALFYLLTFKNAQILD